MKKISKKYMEDFEKLERTWQKFVAKPSPQLVKELRQDLEEVHYGLNHINF